MPFLVRFRTSSQERPERSLEAEAGTSLLEAVRQVGLPIARACGGGGLCAKCGLAILAGGDALEPPSPAEQRAKERNRVPVELRLACQVTIRGPLEVSAGYW
jgi:adenylate cyclase